MIFKILTSRVRTRPRTPSTPGTLAELDRGSRAVLDAVGGERSFRRRLMEMGLVPGTEVAVVDVAPLGDPIQIEVRHARISIRRLEAAVITVRR